MTTEEVAQSILALIESPAGLESGIMGAFRRENLIALQTDSGQVFTFQVREETRDLRGKF